MFLYFFHFQYFITYEAKFVYEASEYLHRMFFELLILAVSHLLGLHQHFKTSDFLQA